MKVLWFAVTPSMYSANNVEHNGGGWIAALEVLLRNVPEVNLAIAFEHTDTHFKLEKDGVVYYPINIWRSKFQRLKNKFVYNTEEKLLIPACLKIIEDNKPDVIHIFGSEWSFGLINRYTNVPVVIHMQGSIPPYFNARFPSGYGKSDLLFNYGINFVTIAKEIYADMRFKLRADREERILRNCNYFMGRTQWDKSLTQLYAPNSTYFYCSEALRSEFFEPDKVWTVNNNNPYIIISTISPTLYKGADLILKTAMLLKQNTAIKFEWRVFGVSQIKLHEKKTMIKASSVNVRLMGTVSAAKLREELLHANVFVHPSYIDNSPNSICEAQLLGVPLVSTSVGGIPSIVQDGHTGLLISSNDPFFLASNIMKIIDEKDFAIELSKQERAVALKRHDPAQIILNLCSIYNQMLNNCINIDR